jgi:hypothetical protein
MADQELVGKLYQQLFGEPNTLVYAVLDGASIPDLALPEVLWEHEPEHVCLYRGELEPDLAATAPYLVALDRDAEFTRWVLTQGWGNHWGIFAITPPDVTLAALRKHFRTFLMVTSPENKPLYFRYYDPRVLRVYLPTCNAEELQTVFGPVATYVCEDEKAELLLSFRNDAGALRKQTTKLGAP